MRYSSVTKPIIYEVDSTYVYAPCDDEIARYYKSFIPKYENVQRGRYQPHITIVRHEIIPKMEFWKKYQNLCVPFEYNSEIDCNDRYWWLPVRCEFFALIREELGLPLGKYSYHMTLGNTKG